MKIYNYNPITGEFISSADADESPLEVGEYLLPAHATEIAPPTPRALFTAVFSSGVWSEIEDHRGERWFDSTGKSVIIEVLGAVQSGLSVVVPDAISAEKTKADRIAQILLELAALDLKKIRPLADGDLAYLATLNAQSETLRTELATL